MPPLVFIRSHLGSYRCGPASLPLRCIAMAMKAIKAMKAMKTEATLKAMKAMKTGPPVKTFVRPCDHIGPQGGVWRMMSISETWVRVKAPKVMKAMKAVMKAPKAMKAMQAMKTEATQAMKTKKAMKAMKAA